jgi:hypothetical protein
VLVREELDRLLGSGPDDGTNIVSALVDTVTRRVVEQLLESEQADRLGGQVVTGLGSRTSGARATVVPRRGGLLRR